MKDSHTYTKKQKTKKKTYAENNFSGQMTRIFFIIPLRYYSDLINSFSTLLSIAWYCRSQEKFNIKTQ